MKQEAEGFGAVLWSVIIIILTLALCALILWGCQPILPENDRFLLTPTDSGMNYQHINDKEIYIDQMVVD